MSALIRLAHQRSSTVSALLAAGGAVRHSATGNISQNPFGMNTKATDYAPPPSSSINASTDLLRGVQSGGVVRAAAGERWAPDPKFPAGRVPQEQALHKGGLGPMKHYSGGQFTSINKTGHQFENNPFERAEGGGAAPSELPEGTAAFMAQREREEHVKDDVFYAGYVPRGVFAIKTAILTDHSLEPEELEAHVSYLLQMCTEMQAVYDAAHASNAPGDAGAPLLAPSEAGDHPSTLTVDDINHVRYIVVIAARLLGDKGITNRMVDAILASDPLNIDAIETRLEVCLSGPDEIVRLRPLLDFLRGQPHVDPKTGVLVENDVYENCFTLLADILLTSMINKVQGDGEGACTVYFGKVVQTLAVEIFPTTRRYRTPLATADPMATKASPSDGAVAPAVVVGQPLPTPNEFGMLIEKLFDCMDEQLYHMSTFSKESRRQCAPVLSAIVAMLKAFISMEANRYVVYPEATGLLYLLRLQTALRMLGRTRECHAIGERMKRHYAQHKVAIEAVSLVEEDDDDLLAAASASSPRPRVYAEGSYAKQYQNALFQHVHDEVIESPAGKKDKVVALIEAYPRENVPWKILAFCFYLQKSPHDAIIACRKAIELLPSDATSVLLLGNLYLEVGQKALSAEIISNFRSMIEMDQLVVKEEARRSEEGTADPEEKALLEAQMEAAKAEIGAHALALEMDASLRDKDDDATKEVNARHAEYLMQMRRAHMYSAKGLPRMVRPEIGLDVAFKKAEENPEFGAEAYDKETSVRQEAATLAERQASIRGMISGNDASNIRSGTHLGRVVSTRRTFRNMNRRDN